ncbi:MAG TPA: alpha/beta hydrolase [Thermoleophilaceae bacterium]
MSYLILHGFQGSGPDHWQTWLARRLRERGERVSYPGLPEPDTPSLRPWLDALDAELREPDGLVVLCHSLACVLWLQHARRSEGPAVERVLLVAPPSPAAELPGVSGFFPLSVESADVARAAVSTRVVWASGDPYCPEGAGRLYAEPLGLPACAVEDGGHINPDAGYGPWPAVERWCLGSAEYGAEH